MHAAVLPRLDPRGTVDPKVAEFLAALRGDGFTGEVRADYATRLSAATDNSIYQLVPAAVVFPRTTADVAIALRLLDDPRFHSVTLTARGGGTGTNGQALTTGIVLDLSRHMAKILELDLQAGRVRVQAGVVLDDLNAFLRPHGVFFAPNLSPSNRATLGGMIATDASGEGSRRHGKTGQHLLGVEVVLRGGLVHRAAPVHGAELDALCARGDLVGRVHQLVRDIAIAHKDEIERTFPRLRRYMTGYNLAHMATPDGSRVDLCRLLAGSEGSLGVVTEASLRLTPIERHHALFVLRFASFDAALSSAEWLVATDPGSLETLDETVLGLAQRDVIYDQVRAFLEDGEGETTRAIHLVEYSGDDEAQVRAKVDELVAEIARRRGTPSVPHAHVVTWKAQERESLWNLRKKGVGLLGNAPGPRKPVPFVEDTVVPPEHLSAYVREFRALLDAEGLRYGMFGHVDVGCLHVRPALDIKDPEDEARVRRITDAVTALVTKYGGLLWGEHGKGFRSELVPHHFGPVLYPQLQRLKALFDPRNQLNPGKVATPGERYVLARVDGPTRGALDRRIAPADREALATVLHCNGNGQCFDTNADNVMCPSSKITRDRIHSPKGRATMMREWLRLLSEQGVVATDSLRATGGRPWPWRWWQRVAHRDRASDFSHEVYDAMAGCLACKACATQCPIKVDVPDFRAQFLELYHRRYARPIGDYLTATLERVLPLLGAAPRLANLLMAGGLGRWFLAHLFGIVDAPRLDPRPVRERLAARGIPISAPAELERLPKDAPVVVVLQDAFTTFYEPEVLVAACLLLCALGYQPHVLPYFENGKALHIKGFLRAFGRVVARNAETLTRVAALGFPLVGVEPAVVLTYRDEYPKLLERDLPARVSLLQEWLAEQPLSGRAKEAGGPPFRLLSHCTEQALVTRAPGQWAKVFGALGVPLEVVKAGCCGMCGVYGHEAAHKRDSLGIFELSWRRAIDPERDRDRLLVTGHSCRTQVERTLGFTPLHPAQALVAALEKRIGVERTPSARAPVASAEQV